MDSPAPEPSRDEQAARLLSAWKSAFARRDLGEAAQPRCRLLGLG
jgi:hypothetical protein